MYPSIGTFYYPAGLLVFWKWGKLNYQQRAPLRGLSSHRAEWEGERGKREPSACTVIWQDHGHRGMNCSCVLVWSVFETECSHELQEVKLLSSQQILHSATSPNDFIKFLQRDWKAFNFLHPLRKKGIIVSICTHVNYSGTDSKLPHCRSSSVELCLLAWDTCSVLACLLIRLCLFDFYSTLLNRKIPKFKLVE